MNGARLLHLLGVLVWVGGMFFAHMVLRPSVGVLEPPQRLALLAQVFARFLAWVGAAVIAIAASGAYMVWALGGMRSVGTSVHVMTGLGLVMMLIYAFIAGVPYRRFRAALAAADRPTAAAALAQIRTWVAINLGVGLLTTVVAVLGA